MTSLSDSIEQARAEARQKAIDADSELSPKARAAAILGEAHNDARPSANSVTSASDKALTAVREHPVATVVGVVAVGAIIGAMLPRGKTEQKYVAKFGHRAKQAAKTAASAAIVGGKDQVGNFIANNEQLRQSAWGFVGRLADIIVHAFRSDNRPKP
jgi:ElaB/YqjD/DUF883 family membrane-anchored ribosome-binding protein